MIGYPAKPQDPAFQPRSQAGLGAGSHSACQRLAGPAISLVYPPFQRMDFVQGWRVKGCLAAGRVRHACILAASGRRGVASRVRKSIPLPPASPYCVRVPLRNFPHFFNDNHVKDFYDKRQ
jgi:hypothetical protein